MILRKFRIKHIQKELLVSINFRLIIWIFFLTFGIFGWGLNQNSPIFFNAVNALLFASCSLTYKFRKFLLQLKVHKLNRDSFSPGKLLFFFSIAILMTKDFLIKPLYGDELAYAYLSQAHAYEILGLVERVLPYSLHSVNAGYLLHTISIVLLLAGITGYILMRRIKNDFKFFFLMMLIMFTLRLIFQLNSSSLYSNPPLGVLPYSVTSTVFGTNPIVFRITTITLFALFATYICNQILKENCHNSIFVQLALIGILTTPLIRIMSTSVEMANWGFLVSVLLMLKLHQSKFRVTNNLVILAALVIYIRISLVGIFLALLVTYILQNENSKIEKLRIASIATLITLPNLHTAIVIRMQSPAYSDIKLQKQIQDNLYETFGRILDSRSLPFLVIFIFGVCLFLANSETRIFTVLYISILILVFIVVNSSTLNFSSKYLVESIFPFSVFTLTYMLKWKTQKEWITLFAAFLIILYAIQNFMNFSSALEDSKAKSRNEPALSYQNVFPMTSYSYESAFKSLRGTDHANCFISGIVYSNLPELMADTSLEQFSQSVRQRDNFLRVQKTLGESWLTLTPESLKLAGIECVVLTGVENRNVVYGSLIANGWKLIDSYPDLDYGTRTDILVR